MKSINQNNRNLNNLPERQTIKRINKLTKSFRSARPGEKVKILQSLSAEIDRTENGAVRNWLNQFHLTLQSMEVAR